MQITVAVRRMFVKREARGVKVITVFIDSLGVQVNLGVALIAIESRAFGTTPAVINWQTIHELAVPKRG